MKNCTTAGCSSLALAFLLIITSQASAQLSGQENEIINEILSAESASESQGKIHFKLNPKRVAVLSAEISGKIVRMPYRIGDSFKKGALLIAIDCRQVDASLGKASAARDNANRQLRSLRELYKRSAVGELEVLRAESSHLVAVAEFESARINKSNCNIRAPFSGKVASTKVRLHERVNIGDELLEVFDHSTYEISMIIPSKWLTWIKVGYRFKVRIAENKRAYFATVKNIGSKVDSMSKTVTIISQLEKPDSSVTYGMTGQAFIAK